MQAMQKICDYFSLETFPEAQRFEDFLMDSITNNPSKDLSMYAITSFASLAERRIPEKISTFGGATDKGDRTNGLAFVDTFGALNPRSIAETWMTRDYALSTRFRIGHMMQAVTWPVVDGDIMGLSYYLDAASDYCAMRVPSCLAKKAFRNGFMMVNIYAVKTSVYVGSVPVIDYGPAEWTKRVIDVSPGIMETLGVRTDDVVCVAWSR